MAPCKTIKYLKKRSSKPIVKFKKPPLNSGFGVSDDFDYDQFMGEMEFEYKPQSCVIPQKATNESLRDWVQKQRFIPEDLSDEFLYLFLVSANYNLDLAKDKLTTYFYSRQEPSPLFRDRDPLSPENAKIFKNLYVIPMPDTTEDGRKIIITGLVNPVINYNQMDHAKILVMVLDLLMWEKDIGFGDFVIIFDGRGFQCPQLLENKVRNHRSVTKLILDTMPISLKAFYLLYPPPYVAKVCDNRSGIWLTVVKSKQEMKQYVPADILPLELGGNLGHVEDLLEQWDLHLLESRNFFVQFEKRMITDYKRRLCHEKEVAEGGKNWVQKMKLEEDEWEYKVKYYERMKNMKPLTHPAFGNLRLLHKIKPKREKDPMERCRKLAKEEAENDKIFEEDEKAKLEDQKRPKCIYVTPLLRINVIPYNLN